MNKYKQRRALLIQLLRSTNRKKEQEEIKMRIDELEELMMCKNNED